MNLEDFKKLCTKRLDSCTALMYGAKTKEYQRGDDKFHNFKRAGQLLHQTPEQALLGMWSKHLISIMDIVDDLAAGRPFPSRQIIDDKFNDGISYLLLLEGLITERGQTPSNLPDNSKNVNFNGTNELPANELSAFFVTFIKEHPTLKYVNPRGYVLVWARNIHDAYKRAQREFGNNYYAIFCKKVFDEIRHKYPLGCLNSIGGKT